jgi:hypothetical protein
MIALYLVLSALMLVGFYECRKGIKEQDYRAAGMWGVVAVVMIGLMVYATYVPNFFI